MKILLVGQSWFSEQFRAAGHEVVTIGFAKHLEVIPRYPGMNVQKAFAEAGINFQPDVIVIWDNSAPIAISGLEDLVVPILFYSIDTHHHSHLHQYLSHFVDETWVAQKDYLNCFTSVARPATWVPLWASKEAAPLPAKEYGAVFVGTLKRELNPERVDFFEALQKKTPILVMQGDWVDIFTKSEIVVNQTVKSDLNFRVFEAMMSGAMLLTESSGNGLHDLFEDKKHLVCYTKNDVDDAAEKINYYLDNLSEMREIAHRGREEVIQSHSIQARTEWFLNRILNASIDNSPRIKNYGLSVNYSVLSRQVAPLSREAEIICLSEVFKSADKAIQVGESVNSEILFNVISSALAYDAFTRSTVGSKTLSKLKEAVGTSDILNMIEVRTLLNRGEVKQALSLANEIVPGSGKDLFLEADKTAHCILKERELMIDNQTPGTLDPIYSK
ncbi:MAG: glycosyltransferase [Bdellovibrionota bacterium]